MKTLFLFFKHKVIGLISVLLISPFLLFSQPTEEEILASIDFGTTWLVAQQNPDGTWNTYERVAYTGFALTKLCDRAYEHFYESPFDPNYEYSGEVIAGFDFLMLQAKTHGPGTGIYMMEAGDQHHEIYNAAISLMAVASTYTPTKVISSANLLVDGMTYAQLVDEMVIYFEWAQNDAGGELGGWGYHPNQVGWSDNSHSGYATLGLRYAEAFGSTIPQGLKDNLLVWIDYIQNDVNGDPDDGGSGYQVSTYWVNQLKTGNLLFEMSFYGDEVEDTKVQDALDYIGRHWDDANSDPGWRNSNQAMFCLMKGFESFSIETIEVSSVERNWFEEFTTILLATQDPVDGNWYAGNWGDALLNTCWALYVLEKVAPPPPIVYVDFDIHPTSWPNPINTKSTGLTPMAILGTEDFDVTMIDAPTLYLDLLDGMVYPIRWAYEDVTQPAGTESECNDTEAGPDGFMDLTLKFDTQEMIAALGEVNDGDVLVVKIVGNLMDDGLLIEGDDCIWIKQKTKKSAISTVELSNYPDPFNAATTIIFTLDEPNHVTLKVYNTLGVEVATLYNGFANAEHRYMLNFNGDLLSEGVYFYVLRNNETILGINKMLMMK